VATDNKSVVSDLPLIISTSIPTALNRYQREDFAAAYAIGNTPWLSAASDQNRISRITTTYQKERIDQGSSAGENSLSNWWLRSATSWHKGAGERYYDADNADEYMFYESNNLNVWNTGNLSLLPATTQFSAVAASNPVTVLGGTFYLENSTLKFYSQTSGTSTTITLPASDVPQKITSDGTYCIVGAANGIYDVTIAGVVRKLYDIPQYAATSWTVQSIAYVKERLVIGAREGTVETGIYEVSREYITPTHRLDANDERWDSKGNTVTINSITELNSAVVVAYTEGVISRVLSFTLNATSALAALNDPFSAAELPRGETINQIRSYLNEYVVLATTRGLRVGTQSTDGQSFTYGPLIIRGNIKDIAFDDSYVYVTRDTAYDLKYGLWRINLGEPVGASYAYASDLTTDTGTVNGIAFIGSSNRKFITSSSGVWLEHATNLATSGYLKSGWIRWGTAENKQPVSVAIRSAGTGTLGFEVYDQESGNLNIGAVPIGMNGEIQLSAALQPADHFEVNMTLTRNSSNTTLGPTVEEWQIRALPAPLRSRTFTIPLLCFEEERDPNGVTRLSNPWSRISYLERIEQNGGAVLFQDFSSGEERVCVIRAIQFEQTSPPSYANGFGGIVTIQLQTIDTEQAIT
jgi:hypothetical protein